jgi:hypothetical protein
MTLTLAFALLLAQISPSPSPEPTSACEHDAKIVKAEYPRDFEPRGEGPLAAVSPLRVLSSILRL